MTDSPVSYLGPVLAFAGVVALIPLALWLLKRTPLGAAAGRSGGMRVVSALPLAPNQRLVTVEVGQGEHRQWLVLGVTPGSIRTLHTLPAQPDEPAPQRGEATVLPHFAQLLRQQQQTNYVVCPFEVQ